MVVLPAPVEPTKGDLLARTAIQVDVVQHRLFRHISEIHIREGDVAFQFVVGGGAVVVGVLPGPDAGALLGLHEVVLAVILGVHEGHIASSVSLGSSIILKMRSAPASAMMTLLACMDT